MSIIDKITSILDKIFNPWTQPEEPKLQEKYGLPLFIRERNIHELKVHPQYYLPLFTRSKTFEVRKKDRIYQLHDILILKEWDPYTEEFTGNQLCAQISCILDDPRYCKEGYVILGLKFIES